MAMLDILTDMLTPLASVRLRLLPRLLLRLPPMLMLTLLPSSTAVLDTVSQDVFFANLQSRIFDIRQSDFSLFFSITDTECYYLPLSF